MLYSFRCWAEQDSVHDWNYMLSAMNLLPKTAAIAGAIRLLGTIAIVVAAFGAFKFATGRRRSVVAIECEHWDRRRPALA